MYIKKIVKINKFFVLAFFIIFLSGCSLEEIDQKIGEGLESFKQSDFDLENLSEVKETDDNNDNESDGEEEDFNNEDGELSQEDKEKIDAWIRENNLNRYGDSQDTIYMGGTPLFDEATGEGIDRYDYIISNHPEILTE